MSGASQSPLAAEVWKACRAHEGFGGPLWDIDPEDHADFDARPFVRIEAAGRTVASAHDLFEFKQHAARMIEAAPVLLSHLIAAMPYLPAEARHAAEVAIAFAQGRASRADLCV